MSNRSCNSSTSFSTWRPAGAINGPLPKVHQRHRLPLVFDAPLISNGAVNRIDGSLDLDDPSPLLVPAPLTGLGQFIGQLATIGHYSFSRCGALAGGGANAGPEGKEVPRVAFLGFEFINTSLEATARVEVERIRLLDDVLRQKLTASRRFEIVDIPPDTIKEIASGPTISNCNGCQRRFAQMVGANWAAWGTVQKVSNLILNINVYMEDAESGKMKFARSVDIRGNTDESWRRGLDYLLRNYLLREP